MLLLVGLWKNLMRRVSEIVIIGIYDDIGKKNFFESFYLLKVFN